MSFVLFRKLGTLSYQYVNVPLCNHSYIICDLNVLDILISWFSPEKRVWQFYFWDMIPSSLSLLPTFQMNTLPPSSVPTIMLSNESIDKSWLIDLFYCFRRALLFHIIACEGWLEYLHSSPVSRKKRSEVLGGIIGPPCSWGIKIREPSLPGWGSQMRQ
jgi:hypothetical protein